MLDNIKIFKERQIKQRMFGKKECKSCGEKVSSGSKFCPHCGNPMNKSSKKRI